ncbi:AAA family ATPase [Shewanella sp. A25]|nr:AAA family ATPase [Shewanella shenzhenensis]
MDIKVELQQSLWDSFLVRWPRESLKDLTLEDYVSVNDQDTFTYWLETKTRPIGSIQGNTSAKFGIYKRGNSSKPNTQKGIKNGAEYSWWEKFGGNEAEAFNSVKNNILTVANAAAVGDLDTIEKIDISPMVKWKIAFLYQNQQQPSIINTFSNSMLKRLVGGKGESYGDMYRKLIAEKGEHGLLDYGVNCWQQANSQAIDLNNQFLAYKDYVQQALTETPPNSKKISCIAVFKVLAEIQNSSNTIAHPSGCLVVDRDSLQQQVIQSYPVSATKKRQEVNKFLSQSFTVAARPEPDFIEFALEDDNELYTLFTRTDLDGVPPGAKKSAFRIRDFDKQSELIDFLCSLSLSHVNFELDEQVDSTMSSAVNQIFYGPPGTGKTYLLQQKFTEYSSDSNERYACVTFHQSYGYEEFIEGLRAKTNDEGNVYYSVEPGSFVKLCRLAEQDPENRYAIFIDEINRGNISKIFGELITLIEPDKRQGEANELSLQLSYSGQSFSVPANVDIYGTMNTADRSLAMMDTALRRRFDFEEMMPKSDLLKGVKVEQINLQLLLETLNQRIEILYDREHTLGHAFFMPVKKLYDAQRFDDAFLALQSVFKNKVIPLLEEYFFDDWSKIRLVLADNQKPEELQFVKEHSLNTQDLKQLFGSKHNLNQFGEQIVKYALVLPSDAVWSKPAAYIGIYQVAVSKDSSASAMNVVAEPA